MNDFEPVTVSHASSHEERQTALYRIYLQVLERQPYHHERKILAKQEKDFLNDKIGVKRFIKELAVSDVYLNAFFFDSSNMKFLELCFKHFLGRSPIDQAEIKTYCDILMTEGVVKMMTAMVDSEEYRKEFGCFTVPYPRSKNFYRSPKAYLEAQLLNHEHFGRRGRGVPTLYWQPLGLNCDYGICRHPEADEAVELSLSQAELSYLLQLLQTTPPDRVFAGLSIQQKELLRQAIG